MFGLGFGELIVIFIVALIFIGPKKLPELAKGLGKGIKEFQNAAKGFSDQMQNNDHSSRTEDENQGKIAHAAEQNMEKPEVDDPPKSTDKNS